MLSEERRLEIEAEERARREIRARLDRESGTGFNTTAAAALSIIPGAGHAYKGQPFNGLAWFLVVGCGYLMLILPGVMLHLVCIYTSTLPARPKREREPVSVGARIIIAVILLAFAGVAVHGIRKAQRGLSSSQQPANSVSPAPMAGGQ